MYVVVRRYPGGAAFVDEVTPREQDLRAVIQGVPGFVAYYAIRSGADGMTITICQDLAGTAESTRRAAEWVRQNVPAVAGSPPEVSEGEVLFNF